MRGLALAALAALPVLPLPAGAASDPLVKAWVVERVDPSATEVVVRGGAGARDHDYAMAAVASATVGRDGRFTSAEGALFFGVSPESGFRVRGPAGETTCEDLPDRRLCSTTTAAGAIAFAAGWSGVTFNLVLFVLRGRDASVDLGENGSPGWRLRRWDCRVRIVANADAASADTALGRGAGTFANAESVGGPGGSVAIGHPPCARFVVGLGGGAVRLAGGKQEVVSTCPSMYPPAAAAPGSTEWRLSGAAAGISDTPARLVVIEKPLP